MTTPNDGSTRITGPTDGPVQDDTSLRDTTTADARTSHRTTAAGAEVTSHMAGTSTLSTGPGVDVKAYKTAAAAVFGLVFGVAALFCALTGILAPAAVVLGLIGIVLAAVGLKTSRRPFVTGHGVAVGGLVTSVLGLLLGAAVLVGVTAIVNDQGAVDRISRYVDKAKANLPSGQEIKSQVPGQG